MARRTLLTFRSAAFNTADERDHFINPGNYGDDLARWLMDRLRSAGYGVGAEPGQEDFGWYLSFEVAGRPYCLVLGYRPGEEGEQGEWIGWLERELGFFASILGRREKGVEEAAPRAIHTVLNAAPEITDIRWHEAAAFRAGREEEGTAAP